MNWVGCQGSEPHFRGFPCSLWILFHFLTVQAAQEGVDHSQERGEWRPRHPLCMDKDKFLDTDGEAVYCCSHYGDPSKK